MRPDFDSVNWVTMFSRMVFWQAYGTTLALAAAIAALTMIGTLLWVAFAAVRFACKGRTK
ncbi:hypothetical protein LHP98_00610 [Rhodobacter sp. Har01]|uniref:hypothetical protein n=1 Tax=Rhodobacter sp. Har01 TaxID=2883999 RepID=UPI001D0857F1|nr:hypothetical protein [Rhodobacter sp. Har01]MCB6176630.1 hypothetical protein [Rhodobacter sp. Har01]